MSSARLAPPGSRDNRLILEMMSASSFSMLETVFLAFSCAVESSVRARERKFCASWSRLVYSGCEPGVVSLRIGFVEDCHEGRRR